MYRSDQQLIIFTAWQHESKFVHDHTWTCLCASAHNGDTVSMINKDTPMPTAKGSSKHAGLLPASCTMSIKYMRDCSADRAAFFILGALWRRANVF